MKLSICCITYNHEKFIAQAIESFLLQKTNFDVEIIIADDCSTDATGSICVGYKKKYPDKINLILRRKNIGMMDNFIGALINCAGEYIAICEGDDYWCDENKLQKQVDFLEAKPGYSICYHQCITLTDSGIQHIENNRKKNHEFNFLDSLYGKNGATLSIVYRSECLNIPQYSMITKDSLIGDWPTELLLLSQGCKGFYMAETMGVYRNHAGGITKYRKISKDKFLEDRLMICMRLKKIAKDKRYLNFFIGELFLHLSFYKKPKATFFFKGFGLVLCNMHFKRNRNINKSLTLQSYASLLFKRIKVRSGF